MLQFKINGKVENIVLKLRSSMKLGSVCHCVVVLAKHKSS